MKNGIISDQEFDEAINFRIRTLKQFEDDNFDILYINQSSMLFGNDDLKARKDNVKTIKKEELINLANKIDLSVVYMLKGERKSE